MNKLSSMKGKTVASVKVVKGGYGLPAEVVIVTTDGDTYTIDGHGEDGGECGHYPGLNLHREKGKKND